MSFVLGYPAPTAPVAFLDLDVDSGSALDLPSPSTSSEPMSPVATSPEEELRYILPIEASQPTLPVVRNGKRGHRSCQRRKDKTKTYKCPVSMPSLSVEKHMLTVHFHCSILIVPK